MVNLCVITLCLATVRGASTQPVPAHTRLWFRQPAPLSAGSDARHPTARRTQLHPLPITNEFIGAIIFGGVERERIQITDPTVGDRHAQQVARAEARKDDEEVRRRLASNRGRAATELAFNRLSRQVAWTQSHQALGDLWVDTPTMGALEDYRREFDLSTGVATVSWRIAGTQHRRRFYASRRSGMVWMRWTCEGPGAISAVIRLTDRVGAPASTHGHHLVLQGTVGNGPVRAAKSRRHFQVWVTADWNGGRQASSGMASTRNELRIDNVDEVQLCLSATSSARETEAGQHALRKTAMRFFPGSLEQHILEHRARFRRMLAEAKVTPNDHLPADERYNAVSQGGSDPGLALLYSLYGRLLLTSAWPEPRTPPKRSAG